MSLQEALSAFALDLERRARAAETLTELTFSMANDAHAALHFRQALVLDEKSRVMAVSGLVKLGEDSPYLLWLKRAWPWVAEKLSAQGVGDSGGGWFAPTPEELTGAPADVAEGWQEWWPVGVWAIPLKRRSGEILGWCAFLLDQPPPEPVAEALVRVGQSWAYAWESFAGKPRLGLWARWQGLTRRQRRFVLAGGVIFLFLPVRQTALAPAEIVPVDAMAMTAALDGVVKTVFVRPNQEVKAGTPLFTLDDTTLRNRLDVAQKSVEVADAELQTATQLSFDDAKNKAELAALTGRAREKRAELAAVQAQLNRIVALAPYDGVAVFSDPDEWQGRPVVTGERIMLLANPDKPGMLIHLPVADAITLNVGESVKLFLTVHPLSPLSGTLTETSYQAEIDGDGIASYRLRASIDGKDENARIGLRGTAKLYGNWVALSYYVLRRPLAHLREWSGW